MARYRKDQRIDCVDFMNLNEKTCFGMGHEEMRHRKPRRMLRTVSLEYFDTYWGFKIGEITGDGNDEDK